MNQYAHSTATSGPDDDRTLILAVEISNRSWVVAAQVPGLRQKSAKQQLAPCADALMAAVEGYKRRAAAAGMAVDRVIASYEPAVAASGSRAGCGCAVARGTSWNPPAWRGTAACAGPRLTASTPTWCWAPSWPR